MSSPDQERNMAKNFFFLIVLILTVLVVNNQTLNAQKEKRLNSSPPAFQAFFSKFKTAVRKSDKPGVAAMTLFPFDYGFDAGDEGTMSKAQFIKRFSEIFSKHPKSFFPEKNPLFSRGDDGAYVVSTEDAAHFVFVKKRNIFKLTAYIVEP
jgi:hypothetical protein